MTKLKLFKVCVLNLIFGTTIIAGDCTERRDEPKRLRTRVIRVDSGLLPEGKVGVLVPRSLIGLEETEEDGKVSICMDRFSLSKAIRDSYKMSTEEDEKLQYYVNTISEGRMDKGSMVVAMNEAVENKHLAIVGWLSTYCPIEDVDVISGKIPKSGTFKVAQLIMCRKEALGEKASIPVARFRSRIVKNVREEGFGGSTKALGEHYSIPAAPFIFPSRTSHKAVKGREFGGG